MAIARYQPRAVVDVLWIWWRLARHTRLTDQPATESDSLLCPDCVDPMTLVRTWPRVGVLAEMHTYQCQPCNVVFTEVVTGAETIPERVTMLHREEFHLQHEGRRLPVGAARTN